MNELAPLWAIEQELEVLLDSLDTCPPELREELETRIGKYITQEVEKVDKVGAVLSSLDAIQTNARVEIERLRARQQAAEKAAGRLEAYVLHVLRQREGKPLKGRSTTFSVRRSEALVITDPSIIPERWKRTTISVDYPKDPMKKAIREGENIPGATIEHRENLARK